MRRPPKGSLTMPTGSLNVPHYKQEFPYSCVAACVRMVLEHHGLTQSEADLRQLLDTRPKGTRVRNLLRLTGLGVDIQLGPANLSQLEDSLALRQPPIAFVDTGPLDYWETDCAHVVVGIDDTAVWLNDPYFDMGG